MLKKEDNLKNENKENSTNNINTEKKNNKDIQKNNMNTTKNFKTNNEGNSINKTENKTIVKRNAKIKDHKKDNLDFLYKINNSKSFIKETTCYILNEIRIPEKKLDSLIKNIDIMMKETTLNIYNCESLFIKDYTSYFYIYFFNLINALDKELSLEYITKRDFDRDNKKKEKVKERSNKKDIKDAIKEDKRQDKDKENKKLDNKEANSLDNNVETKETIVENKEIEEIKNENKSNDDVIKENSKTTGDAKSEIKKKTHKKNKRKDRDYKNKDKQESSNTIDPKKHDTEIFFFCYNHKNILNQISTKLSLLEVYSYENFYLEYFKDIYYINLNINKKNASVHSSKYQSTNDILTTILLKIKHFKEFVLNTFNITFFTLISKYLVDNLYYLSNNSIIDVIKILEIEKNKNCKSNDNNDDNNISKKSVNNKNKKTLSPLVVSLLLEYLFNDYHNIPFDAFSTSIDTILFYGNEADKEFVINELIHLNSKFSYIEKLIRKYDIKLSQAVESKLSKAKRKISMNGLKHLLLNGKVSLFNLFEGVSFNDKYSIPEFLIKHYDLFFIYFSNFLYINGTENNKDITKHILNSIPFSKKLVNCIESIYQNIIGKLFPDCFYNEKNDSTKQHNLKFDAKGVFDIDTNSYICDYSLNSFINIIRKLNTTNKDHLFINQIDSFGPYYAAKDIITNKYLTHTAIVDEESLKKNKNNENDKKKEMPIFILNDDYLNNNIKIISDAGSIDLLNFLIKDNQGNTLDKYNISFDSEWLSDNFFNYNAEIDILQLSNKHYTVIIRFFLLNSKEKTEVIKKLDLILKGSTKILVFAADGDLSMFNKELLGIFNSEENKTKLVDLQSAYHDKVRKIGISSNNIDNGNNKLSLKKFSEKVLQKSLCKHETLSNWRNDPLRKAQLHYAALDAYIIQDLYEILSK